MSHPEIMRELQAWHQGFDKVLKRIASLTYELDTQWDPGINSIFGAEDLTCFAACTLLELTPTAVESSQKPDPPPPPWLQHDA